MAEYASGYSFPIMNWGAADLPKEWECFYQHCQFVFGGPLSKCSESEKICNLMHFVGDKGRGKYLCFEWGNVTVEGHDVSEKDVLDSVVGKFKANLEGTRNPILAAVNLDRRHQRTGESFDDFVTDLILLARGLDIGDSEKLIRNAIACRSLDDRVRQKCIEKGATLTLKQAIEVGKTFEATRSNMKIIDGGDRVPVHHITRKKPASSKYKAPQPKQLYSKSCHRCGRQCHKAHEECPAKDATCYKCSKTGHFSKVCRVKPGGKKKQVHVVKPNDASGSEDDSGLVYVRSLYTHDGSKGEDWLETLEVGNSPLQCQIDTGAKACVITVADFKMVMPDTRVKKTTTRIVSFTNHQIQPLGTCIIPVTHKKTKVEVLFYIIKGNQVPVLSGQVCEELGLIKRLKLNKLDPESEVLKQFPNLKKSTGALPGTYTIKIDPTVEAVVHAPRRQPAALMPKIKDKLKEMVQEGHLIPVMEPTDWVNSMVVSFKNDKIRICLDPTDLNIAVKREHYPMKSVEEIVSQIPEAKLFSVLDAKSGFLQMTLDYESSLLTTMNTPLGRFRWAKLPFGIKSAPELFQRTMEEMLEGISNAFVIMDDILVAGRDKAHHDQVLKEVLTRAQQYNLKLNMSKLKVRIESVSYVGHLITAGGLKADPEKVKAVLQMPEPDSKEAIRRFLGFVQYLAKFLPMLAEVTEPLRELTKDRNIFHWDHPQAKAFQR